MENGVNEAFPSRQIEELDTILKLLKQYRLPSEVHIGVQIVLAPDDSLRGLLSQVKGGSGLVEPPKAETDLVEVGWLDGITGMGIVGEKTNGDNSPSKK